MDPETILFKCTQNSNLKVSALQNKVISAAADGHIDNSSNLMNSNVFIFSGRLDTTVLPSKSNSDNQCPCEIHCGLDHHTLRQLC